MKYRVAPGDTLRVVAQRVFGDARRYLAIAAANDLDPAADVVVGQQLDIPHVTYRYQIQPGDTKQSLAQRFYGDPALGGIFAILTDDGSRHLIPGQWLLVPDLTFRSGYTVRAGDTLPELSQRWYGLERLWPIIAIVNRMNRPHLVPDAVLTQPRLNWRHTVVDGDTLSQLAVNYYGDGGPDLNNRMARIVAGANLIDADASLTTGRVLFFPSLDPSSGEGLHRRA